MGRPIRHDSERRRREFVALVVGGERLDQAARRAGLDPWRALRLVDTSEFVDLLAECRPDLDVTSLREVLTCRGSV